MLFHGVHFDILTQLKITVNTFSIVGGTITSLRQTTTTSGGACVRVTGHRITRVIYYCVKYQLQFKLSTCYL